MIRIEKIVLEDKVKLLFQMDIQSFTRDFDYPARNTDDILSYLKNCEVYFIFDDNQLIGTFSYKIINDQVEVKQLIILPQYQNKGYGKQAMKKLLVLVKDKKVWLITHPKNSAAIVAYLKLGFTINEWRNNYYGDNQPRLLLNLCK